MPVFRAAVAHCDAAEHRSSEEGKVRVMGGFVLARSAYERVRP
jgi:hypothetical protein